MDALSLSAGARQQSAQSHVLTSIWMLYIYIERDKYQVFSSVKGGGRRGERGAI